MGDTSDFSTISVSEAGRMSDFTAEDKMKAAKREANYRRYVYPKQVSNGRMTQEAANWEITVMDEIAADYLALAERERLL